MAHTKQETAFTGLTNKEVCYRRDKLGRMLLTRTKLLDLCKFYL